METLNLQQGSAEWHAVRAKHFTASEAPVMMGESSKMKRDELLEMKKFGTEKEISTYVQKFLFDKGHEFEAAIRPHVEKLIGEELYPATVIDTIEGLPLLVSLDGLTITDELNFEHKMWNIELAESVKNNDLSPEYYWQLEDQMMVCKAGKTLFVCSDGTPENMEYCFYTPQPGRREALIKGWKQFEADMDSYVPIEKEVAAVGKTIEALPSLIVQVSGSIATTNIDDFQKTAVKFIESINTDLQTDQDFADAEQMVKFCDKAEKQIAIVKQQSVDSMADVSKVFRTMDFIAEELKKTRLKLDKTVKAEKVNKKNAIMLEGINALEAFVASINNEIGKNYITGIAGNFAAVVKGKRTITSIQSAVNDEVARVKILVNEIATTIRTNLKVITENEDYKFLFNDLQFLIQKEPDDFALLVKSRIDTHEAEQKEKLEREEIARKQAKENEEKLKRKREEFEPREKKEAETVVKPAIENEINKGQQEVTQPIPVGQEPVKPEEFEVPEFEEVATDEEMIRAYADSIKDAINRTPPIVDENLTKLVLRIQKKLIKAVNEMNDKLPEKQSAA